MRKILLFLSCFYVPAAAFSQALCGFDQVHQQQLLTDPGYQQRVNNFNSEWAQLMTSNSNQFVTSNSNGVLYEIPVVIHVINTGNPVGGQFNPTDAQLAGMISYLNETYAATYASYPGVGSGGVYFPVRFVLAKRDPNCNATSGIVRVNGSGVTNYSANGVAAGGPGADELSVKNLSRWSNTEYYNIWIVNKINGMDGTTGTFTAGYAYFPGSSWDLDGTIMLASQAVAGNIALPHEIGHAFSLYHTFEGDGTGSTCPVNTSCSTQGDFVCDTEPHKRSNFVCPTGNNPCTGASYNNVQRNFMDYSSCQNRFTEGQKTRFMNSLLTSRPGLAHSLGSVVPGTALVPASCIVTGVTNVGNNAGMGPRVVTFSNMTSNSEGYNLEGYVAYRDRSCQLQADVVAGQNYTISVTTATNTQKVAVWIDYDNNGTFAVSERVYQHSGTTASEVHTASIAIPTSAVTCQPLRMRVIADFVSATIPSNGCGTLQYGQAEDFGVVIAPAPVTLTNAISTGTNPSCAGTSLTFTATPSAGVSSPVYTWYLNGSQVQTGAAATYTTATIGSAETVYAVVSYTGSCGGAVTATSNSITVTRNAAVVPAVTVNASATSVCAGTTVNFTAVPANGGTAPAYQWKLNGANVGTNSSTYSNASLANGNTVSCVLTSNAACAVPATANSNVITMTVNPAVTASVSISTASTSVCAGSNVTFTASAVNGGAIPAYQWTVSGINAGTNSSSFTTSSLPNGSTVAVILTSSAPCAAPAAATSNSLLMNVRPLGTWTGFTSNDWFTATNWCGGVPTASSNVIIPASAPFMPLLNGTTTVNSFTNYGQMILGTAGNLTVD